MYTVLVRMQNSRILLCTDVRTRTISVDVEKWESTLIFTITRANMDVQVALPLLQIRSFILHQSGGDSVGAYAEYICSSYCCAKKLS